MRLTWIVASALALATALSACSRADPWEQGFANKICPVQGGEIDTENPALVVEYRGEKIGFCCPGCPQAFQRDPEPYMQDMRANPSAYGYRARGARAMTAMTRTFLLVPAPRRPATPPSRT